jgi:hypothetical protein
VVPPRRRRPDDVAWPTRRRSETSGATPESRWSPRPVPAATFVGVTIQDGAEFLGESAERRSLVDRLVTKYHPQLERRWGGRTMPHDRVMFRIIPTRVTSWGLRAIDPAPPPAVGSGLLGTRAGPSIRHAVTTPYRRRDDREQALRVRREALPCGPRYSTCLRPLGSGGPNPGGAAVTRSACLSSEGHTTSTTAPSAIGSGNTSGRVQPARGRGPRPVRSAPQNESRPPRRRGRERGRWIEVWQ